MGGREAHEHEAAQAMERNWTTSEVPVSSDAFWVRTTSEAVRASPGNLEAAEADATRLRLLVESSRAFEAGDGWLMPSLRGGLRRDGGDAETGTGVEVGAGLTYSGHGMTVEGSVRTLIAHEAQGYEEWGASGSIRVGPGASGRGLSLAVAPSAGAAGSGTERLWAATDTRGLAPEVARDAGHRLGAEVGYGFRVPRTRGLVTPYAGLSLGQDANRTWRTGALWRVAPEVALGLEASGGPAGEDDADNATPTTP